MKNRRKKISDTLNQGNPRVLEMLRMVYAAEVSAWYQYNYVRGTLLGDKNVEVSKLLEAVAFDELYDHADKVQMRIIELNGVVPELYQIQQLNQIQPILGAHSAKEYLLGCAVQEDLTIKWYKALLDEIKQYNDPTTENLLEELIADEEEHCCDMQKYAIQQFAGTFGLQVANLGQIQVFFNGGEVCEILAYSDGAGLYIWSEDETYRDEVKALYDQLNCKQGCTDISQVAACLQQNTPCTCESLQLTCTPSGDDTYCQLGQYEFVEPTSQILDSILIKLGDPYKGFKLIMDSLEEREIEGKKVKVTKFNNAEEANKFLEKNKGFTQVDQSETGEVYLALEQEAEKEQ